MNSTVDPTPSKHRQNLIDKIPVSIEQNETKAGCIRTAYLAAGKKVPVVLLHGAGAGAVSWHTSIAPLAQSFRVIAPDIVGYGESDKPQASYDRPYFSDWLRDFLDSLDIPRAHVVGSSQGGSIALQFALDHPHRVDRLVLADSGSFGARPSPAAMLGMLWLNCFPSEAANRYFTRFIMAEPEKRDPDLSQYSLEVLRSPGGKNVFKNGKGAAVAPISSQQLRNIRQDTLIVWGKEDRLFSIEHGRSAAKTIPNAVFASIANAGHLPFLDQSDRFNQQVLSFLDEPQA